MKTLAQLEDEKRALLRKLAEGDHSAAVMVQRINNSIAAMEASASSGQAPAGSGTVTLRIVSGGKNAQQRLVHVRPGSSLGDALRSANVEVTNAQRGVLIMAAGGNIEGPPLSTLLHGDGVLHVTGNVVGG